MKTVRAADHVGLLYQIARKYRAVWDVEELVQEGALGLMHAVRKFDPKRGIKFTTYAAFWIHAAIGRFLDRDTRLVSLPVRKAQKLRKEGQLPPAPSPIHEDGFVGGTPVPTPEDEAADAERREVLWRAVDKLPRRARAILKMHFRAGMTGDQIGAQLGGISRQAVNEEEHKALKQLREQLKQYEFLY